MKESIRLKLENLQDRYQEVGMLLGDPDIIADQNQFRELSMEYAQLEPVTKTFSDYQSAHSDLTTAQEMLEDNDPDLQEMAIEEQKDAQQRIELLELDLQKLLLPKDPHDNSNIFLEIRAGTGGDAKQVIFID